MGQIDPFRPVGLGEGYARQQGRRQSKKPATQASEPVEGQDEAQAGDQDRGGISQDESRGGQLDLEA